MEGLNWLYVSLHSSLTGGHYLWLTLSSSWCTFIARAMRHTSAKFIVAPSSCLSDNKEASHPEEESCRDSTAHVQLLL